MPRIALGQLNLTVGDLAGNVEKMAAAAMRAIEAGSGRLDGFSSSIIWPSAV